MNRVYAVIQSGRRRRGAAFTLEFALASLVLIGIAFMGSKFGNTVLGYFDVLWNNYDGSRIAASEGNVEYAAGAGVELVAGSTGGYSGSSSGGPVDDFVSTECTAEATAFADALVLRQEAEVLLADAQALIPTMRTDSWVAYDYFALANEAYDDAVVMELKEIQRDQAIADKQDKEEEKQDKQDEKDGLDCGGDDSDACDDLDDEMDDLQDEIDALQDTIDALNAEIAALGAPWGETTSAGVFTLAYQYYLAGRDVQDNDVNKVITLDLQDYQQQIFDKIIQAEDGELGGLRACAP